MSASMSTAAGAPSVSTGGDGRFADLHLHTFFSDGTFSPEELEERGKGVGLAAMALTDHDTVEGCERMAQACAAHGIEFVAGSELTAEFDGKEVHLLGYFLDTANEMLCAELKRFQAVRQARIEEMVRRLNLLNIPLEAESVFRLANCRSPGRPHVGRALVQEGLCGSLDEAFDRFLKKGRPAWVPKCKVDAMDAITLIHQAGGLAVMAHPALNQGDELIPQLVRQGLDGLECFHTRNVGHMPEHYMRLAARYNLLVTGGSDCHGYSKGKPLIGGVKLPGVYFDKLKEARRQKARAGAA